MGKILTHGDAENVRCGCQSGHLAAQKGSAVLRVRNHPVLLESEIQSIRECQTPDDLSKGLRRCRQAQLPQGGRQRLLRLARARPVMESLQGWTDGTNPAPVPYALKAGTAQSCLRVGAGVAATRATASVQSPAPITPLAQTARGQQLPPGVYLASRKLAKLPAGVHQFLLLVPRDRAGLEDVRDLGQQTFGFTLAAHNPAQHEGLDQLIQREDYLTAVRNEDGEFSGGDGGDLSAAKEWLAHPPPDEEKWDCTLSLVAPAPGDSLEEFIRKLAAAFDNFRSNTQSAPVEYPLLGGVLVHLAPEWMWLLQTAQVSRVLALVEAGRLLYTPRGRCFNSNSWTHGILDFARGVLPESATDLNGIDLCYESAIPGYYFQDNRERIHSAKKRRDFQPTISDLDPGEGLKQAAERLVQMVLEDVTIRNKAEVVLEDLNAVLLRGEPFLGAEPLNPDHIRPLWRIYLSLHGARSIAGTKSPVEACLAGLYWGFYGTSISQLLQPAVVFFEGGKPYPLTYLLASAAGRDLSTGRLELAQLPETLGALMRASLP